MLCAAGSLVLVLFTVCSWLCSRQSATAALLVPPIMYGALITLLLLPMNIMQRPVRSFFSTTLLRVLLPLQPVNWADFLLADMLTSLAKSCADLERAVCLMLHGPLAHPAQWTVGHNTCGPLSYAALTALMLPFVLRLVQCLWVWKAGGPGLQLANAAKYATSLPAMVLTAMEHECHIHK